LRTTDGRVTRFDAGTGGDTNPTGINDNGDIVGSFYTVGAAVGFIRASDGTITTFNAPDGGDSIYPACINNQGVTVGYDIDAKEVGHGFLRAKDGTITLIDPPGSLYTAATWINKQGDVVGDYRDGNRIFRGFHRTPDGTITRFDVPGSRTTYFTGINNRGSISGYFYNDIFAHAFVLQSSGRFFPINGGKYYSYAYGISDNDLVVGYDILDKRERAYGFVGKP